MARNFAESIEVQHNFISQGERQFHKYWFIFLCSTSESHCHIIHLCSHWHLSRSELKSWNSKFTFLQPGKREIIFLLNSNVVVPIRCFVLIWNWKMFLLKTIFCQTVFILQATWLYRRIFLGFIGRKDNGFLIIKQLAVPYFCDIFTKPNCAFVLFSWFCKKKVYKLSTYQCEFAFHSTHIILFIHGLKSQEKHCWSQWDVKGNNWPIYFQWSQL